MRKSSVLEPPHGAAPSASSGGSSAERLGILTKFVDRVSDRTTVDPESGEVKTFTLQTDKTGHSHYVERYDPTAQLLERWLMKKQARKLLMVIEERQKRTKVLYTKVAPLPHPDPSFIKLIAIGQGFRFEDAPNRINKKTKEVIKETKKSAVYRVINCGRDKIDHRTEVEIWKSKETDSCTFHKVQVCGSVWTCPTCSAKINLQRQKQIQACYDVFSTLPSSDCMMVTLTIRHGYSDQLKDTLEKMKEAFRLLQQTSAYKKIAGHTITRQKNKQKILIEVPSEFDFAGRISATEMTYGKSGWHPHFHQLWFFNRKITPQEIDKLRSMIFAAWESACVAVGLAAPLEFHKGKALGVDVRRAWSAAEYLSKFGNERQWGPEKEMASAHAKKAKLSGRTPFQILFDSMQGDAKSGLLFQDYAAATIGKHQLEFSKNLRARLRDMGVFDLDQSDEDISYNLQDDSDRLGMLSDSEFTALAALPSSYPVEPFSTVLSICRQSGFQACRDFIHGLPTYDVPIVSTVPYESTHLRKLRIKYG